MATALSGVFIKNSLEVFCCYDDHFNHDQLADAEVES